jgi:hypothetical protein
MIVGYILFIICLILLYQKSKTITNLQNVQKDIDELKDQFNDATKLFDQKTLKTSVKVIYFFNIVFYLLSILYVCILTKDLYIFNPILNIVFIVVSIVLLVQSQMSLNETIKFIETGNLNMKLSVKDVVIFIIAFL